MTESESANHRRRVERDMLRSAIGSIGVDLCKAHGLLDQNPHAYASTLDSFRDVFVTEGGADDPHILLISEWIDDATAQANQHRVEALANKGPDEDPETFYKGLDLDREYLNGIIGLVAYCGVWMRYGERTADAMMYGRQDYMVAFITLHENAQARQCLAETQAIHTCDQVRFDEEGPWD